MLAAGEPRARWSRRPSRGRRSRRSRPTARPAPSASGAAVCSTRSPPCRDDGFAAELVLAADQFIITPAGRVEEAARARAAGDEVRTVIAGYHWFTDWGRDTMISLEGLTLSTGRYARRATSCARSRTTSATA